MRDYKTKEEVEEIRARARLIIDEMGISDFVGVSGLYFIKIYDKIVYIGSSKKDLAYRVARHKMHILDPTDEPELKYDVMREVYSILPNEWRIILYPFDKSLCEIEEYKLIEKYKPIFNEKYAIYDEFTPGVPVGYKYINKEDYPKAKEVLLYVQSGVRS